MCNAFSMGPGSPISKLGVQITDSPYVVVNMRIMTWARSYELINQGVEFVKCLHSVEHLEETDVAWPCVNGAKYISHFPEERLVGPMALDIVVTPF